MDITTFFGFALGLLTAYNTLTFKIKTELSSELFSYSIVAWVGSSD